MLPYASTRINIERPGAVDRDAAGYGGASVPPVLVASNVRASITRARTTPGAYATQADAWTLLTDPATDVRRHDLVTDLVTGWRYTVETVVDRVVTGAASSLNHRAAELTLARA